MSTAVKQQSAALDRLQLKLSINRALSNCNNADYLSQIAYSFRKQPRELFNSVLEEMANEGLIKKMFSKRGSVVLIRCCAGVPINPEHAVEDALPEA